MLMLVDPWLKQSKDHLLSIKQEEIGNVHDDVCYQDYMECIWQHCRCHIHPGVRASVDRFKVIHRFLTAQLRCIGKIVVTYNNEFLSDLRQFYSPIMWTYLLKSPVSR